MFESLNIEKKPVIIRIISSLSIILLVLSSVFEVYKLLYLEEFSTFFSIFGLALNTAAIILCSILIIFPARIGILSILSFAYTIWIMYLEPTNIITIFLLYLTFIFLIVRGFYSRHKTIKIFFSTLIALAFFLYPLTLGFTIFLSTFLQNIIFSFCLLFVYILLRAYSTKAKPEKVLKISDYDSLSKRDYEWLLQIQNGEKYEVLAIEYNLSVGSVKNRLKNIYKILDVSDRTEFEKKFKSYKIVF